MMSSLIVYPVVGLYNDIAFRDILLNFSGRPATEGQGKVGGAHPCLSTHPALPHQAYSTCKFDALLNGHGPAWLPVKIHSD